MEYDASQIFTDQNGWNRKSSVQIETMCYSACLGSLGYTWKQTTDVRPACDNQPGWMELLDPFVGEDSAALDPDLIEQAELDVSKLEQNCVVGPFTVYESKQSMIRGFPDLEAASNSYFRVVGANRAHSRDNAIGFRFRPPNPHIAGTGSPPECHCIQRCPFYTCAHGIDSHASVHDREPVSYP